MVFFGKMAAAGAIWLAALAPAFAGALELVMFERPGCVYCARWNSEVAPAYPLTPQGKQAPLARAQIHKDQTAFALASPVIYTPTFVLMKDGREAGRIVGYANDAMFWGLLSSMIEREGAAAEAPGAGEP